MKEVGENQRKCEELKEVVLGAAEIVSGSYRQGLKWEEKEFFKAIVQMK